MALNLPSIFKKRQVLDNEAVEKTIFIPATELQLEDSVLEYGSTSAHPVVKMPDTIVSSIYFSFLMPKDTINDEVQIKLYWYSKTAANGVISLTYYGNYGQERTAVDGLFMDNTVTAATSGATLMNVYTFTDTLGTQDIGGNREGDLVGIELDRNANIGADTLNEDIYVLGVEITFWGK